MLKWSVTRKVSETEAIQPRRFSSDAYMNKRQEVGRRCRRSVVSQRRSLPRCGTPKQNEDPNKENCFTSTPIKSLENHNPSEALKDVSNLTPNVRMTKRFRDAQNDNIQDPSLYSHSEKKKKKKACTNLNRSHSDPLPFSPNKDNRFEPFGVSLRPFRETSSAFKTVTPIKEVLGINRFAPTLPTFDVEESPCYFPNGNSIFPNRKSCPSMLSLGNCDIAQDTSKLPSQVNVSPLVKRLTDLRFSKISYNGRSRTTRAIDFHNNSSYINNLSLDKIVDEILDSADESKEQGDPELQERENDFNETHEENLINTAQERYISASTSSCDRVSFDSGFSSTSTKQTHEIGVNFVCKCSDKQEEYFKKWRRKSDELCCDKTIIDLSETFNERCVDTDVNKRNLKRALLESSSDNNTCTLKRQKCIRRRKTISGKPSQNGDSHKIHQSFNFTLSDNKYGSFSPFNDTFWESKNNTDQTYSKSETPQSLARRTRRCLSFDTSPVVSQYANFSSTPKSRGTMDIELFYRNSEIVVKVLRCRELNRSGPEASSVNAYAKVSLIDRFDSNRTKNGILRTVVQANSSKPIFNHSFSLPITKHDTKKKIHVEVWHRDHTFRRSELLGCMSFAVKNIIKKDVAGTFQLLSQTLGRNQNVPSTSQNLAQSFASANSEPIEPLAMGDSQATNEEIMSIDDFEGDLMKTTNPATLNQHQKDADENLFLRYLELDPTEGPDAIPAALQRKATGNKNGRTPFTTTKKLVRPQKSGFGFSVVWTHPPRIERVEKGLPADKAGIFPGDYIIFVDKHNVVMMPEIDILNLIRSYGNQITLEIFRRNSSRNGSTLSIRPLANSSGLPTASCITQHRPSTVGSVNTASVECSKRRLHLPQVTFSAEVGNGIIV